MSELWELQDKYGMGTGTEIFNLQARVKDLETELHSALTQLVTSQDRVKELEAEVQDFREHGRVTKAWGELRAENKRLREALEKIKAKVPTGQGQDWGCEIWGIAEQALGGEG